MKTRKSVLLVATTLFAGLAIAVQTSAQSPALTLGAAAKSKIITFEAPGAGKGAGQGTIANEISPSGSITGEYIDARFVFHGYVRASDGIFTSFDAPGAGSGPYGGTNAWSINPAGAITGDDIDSNGVWHGYIRAKGGSIT